MKIARFGMTLAAVNIVAIALAVPAEAHPAPFTVTAGTAAAGTTVAFSASTGTVAFKDTTSNQNLTCTSVSFNGAIKAGTATSGTKIATINGAGAKFNGCTGPAGWKFAFTGVGTWYLNISDSTAGVGKVLVSNVVVNVKATSFATCSFTIGANSGAFTGTVAPDSFAGTYTNSTQRLAVPATNPGFAGLWNVKGTGTNPYCISPSILKLGDKFSFSAQFTVRADVAAYNPILIT